jgi:hypothetical protein
MLYPSVNQQGVTRKHVKVGSPSADIVELMNRIANECRQRDHVVKMGGEYLVPQPLIEDTIPPVCPLSLSLPTQYNELSFSFN